MKHSFMRGIGIAAVLVALLTVNFNALAQTEGNDITVVGSGIAGPVFQAAAAEAGTTVNLTVTGTNTGFIQFCADGADVTTATRPMSADENAACLASGVAYVELVIGHDAVALITNPEADFLTCITQEQMNTIFAPSVQETISNWNQVIADGPDQALAVYIPDAGTSTHAILDRVVEGDGIRADANVLASGMEIAAATADDTGSIGVLSVADAQAAGDTVRILEADTGLGCRLPDAQAIEGGLYALADTLYVYANLASLQKPELQAALAFASGSDAEQIIADRGFLAPTQSAYTANQQNLAAAASGETVARAVGDAAIPTDIAGQIAVGGAASARGFIQASVTSFNAINPAVVVNASFLGEPAGFRQFCNGEINILAANNDPSPEQVDNCAANTIQPLAVSLGQQAAVLIANAASSDYLSCLRADQLVDIWASRAAEAITTWNQVSSEFPDTPITLFAPRAGSLLTDLLLLSASGESLIERPDTQQNDDPLYRAAAAANVEGALALMSWPEYQRVLANNQANIQLVAVDDGDGCVLPAPDTIADGSYPLTLPTEILFNESALAAPEVQAFALFLASSDNYTNLENQGFIGLLPGDMAGIRDRIQRAALAAQAEAAAAAEVTPEPETETEATEAAETTPDAEGN